MKQCPVCTLELSKVDVPEQVEELFICKGDAHEDVVFSASYKENTEELVFFSMMMGKYYIENCYAVNKTNILIKSNDGSSYLPFLFLPLVHFELCDFISIKSKLKLLVMMY